ncbi:MAG: CDP-alcohol phosphatidyltransferase family protein [Candidatus Poseidoniaceae archaeon]|nr:CDP-alcohol phosphatidyltransferase family protein [Candidatus Poseidoniaceae archaeon]
MKTTYRMMGIADYITLFNGLLGTAAILFIILAVEDLHQPYYQGGLKTHYIWLAMLCILASVIGDIIDGPIARKYSKRKLLGGSLDIMSDCLSFCVAPALLIFVMFGRWGEASPFWTLSLAIASCWIIATGMLRLARFQYDQASNLNHFIGLSSPGNALLLLSIAGVIWIQPSTGIGPELTTWDCAICFGKGSSKPYFDFLMVPIMFISGGLMISDKPMSKLKGGIPMKLSVLQLVVMLIAILHSLNHTTKSEHGNEMVGLDFSFFLFIISTILVISYIILGEKVVENINQDENVILAEE